MTDGDRVHEELRPDEPAPAEPKATLPQPGRTRSGRIARRVTSGPGSVAFEAARHVRRYWWRTGGVAERAAGRLRPLPRPVGHDRVGLRVSGQATSARVDDLATVRSAHLRLLVLLHEALATADVPYFVQPRDQYFYDLGVPAGYREAVWQALAAVAAREPIMVRRRDLVRDTLFRAVQTVSAWTRDGNVLRVFPVVTSSKGERTLPESASVEVHLWAELPHGVLGAPVRNRHAPYLLASTQERVTTLEIEGEKLRTFVELAQPNVDDIDFPIDVVFTWVDDTDPEWQERMLRAREEIGSAVTANALAAERFRNFDELRYSLRSIAMYAPWVRHVWIVTDDQVPAWLDTTCPGVSVVHHREIWSDQTALPVFNSHAIEARLHHIPGLAEHYLYLNDDMFFGQLTSPLTFFTPGGQASIFASPEQIGLGVRTLKEGAAATAAKNDRRILRQATGVIQTQRIKHAGYPQLRSVAHELEGKFPEDYERTARSTFRSPEDISAVSLQTWYGYRTGRSVPGRVTFSYVDLRGGSDVTWLNYLMANRGVDTFCLNQSEHSVADPELLRGEMLGFLEQTFPFRSVYERT
jgi:Stealth protein CR2, conserved region 2/Stealth protein CR3, conserved region 3/Stealth protein CR1, conserved region 1